MNAFTRNRISFLIIITFVAVGVVYAQVIAPTGVVDFPWVNGTRVNTAHFYINGTDYTNAIIFGGAAHDQDLNTTAAVTFATVNTGLGANELYDMDQNVLTTSGVVFEDFNTTSRYVMGLELHVVDEIGVDMAYVGQVAVFNSSDVITAGQLLRWDQSGKIQRADADAANTMPCVCLALNSTTATHNGKVLMQGWIYNSAWTLAEGQPVFVSTTGGAVNTTAPSGSGDQVQVVGIGQTEDLMWFNPDYTVLEIS